MEEAVLHGLACRIICQCYAVVGASVSNIDKSPKAAVRAFDVFLIVKKNDWSSFTGDLAMTVLFRLYACAPDHLRPFLRFGDDEVLEFGCR